MFFWFIVVFGRMQLFGGFAVVLVLGAAVACLVALLVYGGCCCFDCGSVFDCYLVVACGFRLFGCIVSLFGVLVCRFWLPLVWSVLRVSAL